VIEIEKSASQPGRKECSGSLDHHTCDAIARRALRVLWFGYSNGMIWFAALATGAVCGASPIAARSLEEVLPSVVTVLPEWPPHARRSEEPEASGVVWNDGRHVVTAYHAVAKALSIRIRTVEGVIHPVKLGAFDAATDIAILELDQALPAAELSNRTLRLGERVCAIGNAFGLGQSVTCGVVSGVNKSGVGFNPIEDFVQTDAAVNPGASGGALVDGEGMLVGVLSAIFTKTSDANIGVNFAISAALVQRVVNDLIAVKKVRRVDAGLRVQSALPAAGGGRLAPSVMAVMAGSPAERSGVKAGDKVVEAGGRRITNPESLMAALALAGAPAKITLLVEREGRDIMLTLDIPEPAPR